MIIDFILQNWIFLLILLGSFLAVFLLYLIFNIRTVERPKRQEPQPVAKEPVVSEAAPNESGSSPIEPIVVGGEIVASPVEAVEPTANPEPDVTEAAEQPHPSETESIEPKTTAEAPQKQKKTLGRYHVLYRSSDEAWIVKREGSDRILRVLETQKDAITFANIKALSNDTQIVIHKKDGKIRKQNYRKDDED
jgi:hypothetical protein